MADGFIDLGKTYNPKAEIAVKEQGPKTSYPTLFVSHDIKDDGGLNDLPDGEFEFVGKAKIVSYKENMKDGTCQCEIEVMAIKPSTKKTKKSKTAEDSLDSAFDETIKKKTAKKANVVMADEPSDA